MRRVRRCSRRVHRRRARGAFDITNLPRWTAKIFLRHLGDRALLASKILLVRVRYPGQPRTARGNRLQTIASGQLPAPVEHARALERAPERLRLSRADVELNHFPVALLMDTVASTADLLTTAATHLAPSSVFASREEEGIAVSSIPLRNASTCSSRPGKIRETSDFEVHIPKRLCHQLARLR